MKSYMTLKRPFLYYLAAGLALLSHNVTAAQLADFVFHHGSVYTVSLEQPWAEAVAVSGQRIVYVGTDEGAKRYIGKDTRVIDLNGAMLLPGFVDSHSHISSLSSLSDAALTFRGEPPEKVLVALRDYVKEHPDAPLIRGTGWIPEAFPKEGPDKFAIDPIIPDRPAVLMAIDGHHMWVNSKALEIAGIDADTSDPEPGVSWFQRVPDSNEPTGFVVEAKAMKMILDRLEGAGYPFYTRKRFVKGLETGLPMLSASGITTIYDAGMRNEETTYEILSSLLGKGKLPLRIFGSHRYYGNDGDHDLIKAFRDLRELYHSEHLAARMIKIVLDGSENNHTGYMLKPYTDRPETRGLPFYETQELNHFILEADAADIDVHMHVVGDAGARMGLDAVAHAAEINGSRDRRHTLSHTIFVHPDDVPRFRQLGVIWQSTPSWTRMSRRNMSVREAVGEERFARIYPFQEALDAGNLLAFGADFGSLRGTIFKPLEQIEIGHTRRSAGQPEEEPSPGGQLDIAELIRAYTINGAYMLRMEDRIGSIQAGKLADLVVLEKNLFDLQPHKIHKTRVLMTMMDGKVTYRADGY